MNAKDLLFIALAIALSGYLVVLVRGLRAAHERLAPTPLLLGIGFVTNFFDTLGIGSFATTTAMFKLRRMVPVKLIPGTLNVGHTIPTIAQAFIYTRIVPVDSGTLISLIAAAVVGAWVGAGVVVRWPRRKIQIGMGLALLGAASLMLMQQLQVIPGGGEALALSGVRLVIGIMGNFVLGMLMMIGIGLYAPCMILIYLLGMTPTAAFPIMMGSCAFLMPTSSMRFVRERAFHPQSVLGLAIGGLPAVLIAAFIVKSLPLAAVRWLVVAVVIYTAANMLMTAKTEESEPVGAPKRGALQPEV
jgi:uncharacterized membrane protein YfcA